MRLTIITLLWLVLLLTGFYTPASAQSFVGVVKRVDGGVTIERQGESLAAVRGMQVNRADVIKTDGQGYVGLVFSDDTRLSMGPGTEIVIDDYLFEPLEKKFSFLLRLVHGAVSFLSGQMAKLSPESVELVMSAATIGVRGTHVLVRVD